MKHSTSVGPSLHPCGRHELAPARCPECLLEHRLQLAESRCAELAEELARAERQLGELEAASAARVARLEAELATYRNGAAT